MAGKTRVNWENRADAPFKKPVTVLQAEGSKVALNVYTGTAIEAFTARWNSARAKAEGHSGLLVNDRFYEHSMLEQNEKIYVDLMSLGEALDMTYSNMSFEHVIKTFGTNEEDVEFVSVIHNSEWGFGMHFVKFVEGSSEVHDRVFVEYYAAGETYLKELELGKFADNAGELLIVPNADAPLMYVNVQALEQILGLNGVLSKNDTGYVLEITQGDLKPKHVVIDDEQYTTVVLRETVEVEVVDDYTKWDASSMTLEEAKEKIWADGEMSIEESLWLVDNYRDELEASGKADREEKEKETTGVETTQAAEKETQVAEKETQVAEKETQLTNQPSETTQAPTQAPTQSTSSGLKIGSTWVPNGNGAYAVPNQGERTRVYDYYNIADPGTHGPGENTTATGTGMTGEAGRVIEWTDYKGRPWTAVTSGEVVYVPNKRAFYDVVTPLTANGMDVEEATQGSIEKSANYIIIKTIGSNRVGLDNIRDSDLRAY